MNKRTEEKIFDLLQIWYFLRTADNVVWPSAVIALETKIQKMLEEYNEQEKESNERQSVL